MGKTPSQWEVGWLDIAFFNASFSLMIQFSYFPFIYQLREDNRDSELSL